MEDRVNWRMEYTVHAWILKQEQLAAANRSGYPSPILDQQVSRDEIVRNLLTEIETHDGLFGGSAAPESIL